MLNNPIIKSERLVLKKTIIVFILLSIVGLVIFFLNSFNVNFATDVVLTLQHHGENDIDVKATDEVLIKELKSICRGFVLTDSGLSCGFVADFSMTFSNSEKSITVYPPLDNCSMGAAKKRAEAKTVDITLMR